MCPRCRAALTAQLYRGLEIDVCDRCEGIWLDSREFDILTTERDVFRDERVPTEYRRGKVDPPEAYFPCARCGELMNRTNFAAFSNVLIDFCRDCGCWFDKGELARIRNFIASGGLGKARDKKLARHDVQLQSMASRLNEVEFMQRLLHKWKFQRWRFQGF